MKEKDMQAMEESALARLVEHDGLAIESVRPIIETFQPMYDRATVMLKEADGISVTDATQVTEIKKARAMRLQLKGVRVEIENARKSLKEESLRKGRSIDGLAGKLKALIEPAELRLEQQEQFAERAEAARKAALREGRAALIAPYAENPSIYPLGDMTDAAFDELSNGLRLAHEAKIAAAKKAEEERIAAERAKAEEDKRIRAENERLRLEAEAKQKAADAERAKAAKELAEANAAREKAEAAAKAQKAAADKKLAEERAKAEAAIKAERDERDRLERAAAAAKAEAEKKAAAERAAQKAAALAPDRDKIASIAKAIRSIQMPSVSSPEAKAVLAEIVDKTERFAVWIEQKSAAVA